MVTIDQSVCSGCGLCVSDCVAQNIRIKNGKAAIQYDCMQCGHCVAICPQNAASIPAYPLGEVLPYEAEKFSIQPQNFLNAVKFRRSIRKFKEKSVEPDKLARVLEVGRYTETAVNYQDVRFIVVEKALDEAKRRIWEGWRNFALSLRDVNPDRAALFMKYYTLFQENPAQDRLFFNAPILLVIAADVPLDGGLAAANIETMAVAEGLGVLFDGYIVYALEHNPEAKKWLGVGEKKIAAAMLLGYPDVFYRRTAPRRPADIVLK